MADGILGNAVGAFGFPKTYVITDSDGNELTATYVESETIFTATDNDVRTGMVYASDSGVSTGTKDIPAYHTYQGVAVITSGSKLEIRVPSDLNLYDYTKLQTIICSFNTNLSDSVAADKVSIDDNVYNVQSTNVISTISKIDQTKTIDFGITNESGNMLIIRFFMYKEIK